MTRALQVLVVATHHGSAEANRITRCLGEQTYRETKLVFTRRGKQPLCPPPDDNDLNLSPERFASLLGESQAAFVLFWPDGSVLQPAAIEKLVLALALAPDQAGVADAERGATGLWLVRNQESTRALLTTWPQSQTNWMTECHRTKPKLFFIAEHLLENADSAELQRPFAVEHLFSKLPLQFENLCPVSSEPIWPIPAQQALDDQGILFVVSSLPMGGACKFILDVAEQFKANGRRVTVVTTTYSPNDPNPWLDRLLQIIPDVFVLSHQRSSDLPRTIVHLARSRGCRHLVLSHCMLGYQLLPWLRTQLPEVAFLDYTHIEYETEWPDGGYALRSVAYQSLLDLSLVSSEHLKGWMQDRGAEAGRIRVCHTNIDTDKWKPSLDDRASVRQELGLDSKTPMILYPCRIAEQKRPELLCNIVAALCRATQAPFVVVVAGNGSLLPALESFVRKNSLESSFKLLGAVPLDRVARLHNAADIFLLPSLIEGIALALFEAMALESVPVVADVGGQRELLTSECGYLIPQNRPEIEVRDYVLALKHLIEQPARRMKMAAACRQRVLKNFRIGQMTANFIAALKEATQSHEHHAPRLPEAAVCREMATLAIDQIRLDYERLVVLEIGSILQSKVSKRDKIIAKLSQQLESARAAAVQSQEADALSY